MGCAAKKTALHVEKSHDKTEITRKDSVEQRAEVKAIDTTKTKVTTSEKLNYRVIEQLIFDDSGRPKSYTKTTEGTQETQSNKEEQKGKSSDSTSLLKTGTYTHEKKDVETYTKDKATDRKESSFTKVYIYLGIGIIIICIALGLRFYFKK